MHPNNIVNIKPQNLSFESVAKKPVPAVVTANVVAA
jgi:hypothetical protein